MKERKKKKTTSFKIKKKNCIEPRVAVTEIMKC